jgi:hypothetical protein
VQHVATNQKSDFFDGFSGEISRWDLDFWKKFLGFPC